MRHSFLPPGRLPVLKSLAARRPLSAYISHIQINLFAHPLCDLLIDRDQEGLHKRTARCHRMPRDLIMRV